MAQVFEGIDGLLRAQSISEDGVDAALMEALHLAFEIADEVADGKSVLHAYLKEKRTALVDAFKALPSIKPDDVASILTLQRAIEQYADIVRFLTQSIGAVQSLDDDDDMQSDSPAFDDGPEDGDAPPPEDAGEQ